MLAEPYRESIRCFTPPLKNYFKYEIWAKVVKMTNTLAYHIVVSITAVRCLVIKLLSVHIQLFTIAFCTTL